MTALTPGPSDARPLPRNASHVIRVGHAPRAVCRQVRRNGLRVDTSVAMPPREQSAGHFLPHECIREVVAPVAVDVQETTPQPFFPEAELFGIPPPCGVLGTDVDLDPVQ